MNDNEEREQERWVNTAFCAIAIIGLPEREQGVFLRRLLRIEFSDAPSAAPPQQNTRAWAAYAVKLLLRALTEDTPEMRTAAEAVASFSHEAENCSR